MQHSRPAVSGILDTGIYYEGQLHVTAEIFSHSSERRAYQGPWEFFPDPYCVADIL